MNSSNDGVNRNDNSQSNGRSVRCVLGLITIKGDYYMSRLNDFVLTEELNDICLEDFFKAYYQCRKNKKSKLDCLEFDIDYEENLIELWEEVKSGDYKISPTSFFIVEKPVKREICASSFRDRVIHHLIVMKLEKMFEREFIYDSYSCRKGKGTLFGINRLNKFIRKITHNYNRDAYVLKLDIKSYFMSINKLILLEKLENFLKLKYIYNDKEKLIWLCQLIILNDATNNCTIKCSYSKWDGLPKSKSLFHTNENCGLPIGNYTSQIFSNFYLNSLDHFVKSKLKIKFYGRYVDDFFLLSTSREELKDCIPKIQEFLKNNLQLELHPNKIYLQNITHGVEFLGAYIKPWRRYITPRVKNNFYCAIAYVNTLLEQNLCEKDVKKIQAILNSYLGLLLHFNTYYLRSKLINILHVNFWNYFKVSKWYFKVVLK